MNKGSGNEYYYNDTYPDLGVHSYTVWANDTSDNWNFTGPGDFTIQDSLGPELTNLNDAPDPQENGGSVNITVDVTDNVAVDEVWVNVTYPDSSWNNVSMIYGSGDTWYYETAYPDLGSYSYTVWANDTSDNWNSSGPGAFTIQDTDGPVLANLVDSPDPQENGGFVNITLDVSDDIGVFGVWVNITFPNGTSLNTSMIKGSGSQWFYNTSYSDLGTFSYTVWANDTSDNWNNLGPQTFTIQDTDGPVLANLNDIPDPAENGGNVNITVDVTDDMGVDEVWVNITYPDSSWTNLSMIKGSGDEWIYETPYADLGGYSYTVWANDTSDNWNFVGPGTFTIQDTDGPTCANLDDTPDPQEIGGYVNITVDVTDDIGVSGVWVNITNPDSTWSNVSMLKGAGIEWFYNTTYSDLGSFSYTVWANDTSDNWDTIGPGTFTIQDTQGPDISNLVDTPDPQQLGGYVNITVDITDSVGVGEVWVNITYPNGTSVNVTMNQGSGDEWFLNSTYLDSGVYSYIAWANDTSDNWNFTGPSTFTILGDITPPELSNPMDTPDPQNLGGYVNISVDVTDDYAVGLVWVNITYPNGTTLNVSMNQGAGDGWFLNSTYLDPGVYSYTIWANDTSNNWNFTGPFTFTILGDVTAPQLSNLKDNPDPQNPGGNVNITVDVTDDIAVGDVWVNITYPNGTSINVSMTSGVGDEWFYDTNYVDMGVYTYTVWANDTSSNWNLVGPSTFTIIGDVTPPELSNLADTPDPQNPGGNVNITVDITDDYAVDQVWINITYPNGTSLNISMSKGAGDEWFYDANYVDLGVYSYTVWANDTSDNWNFTGPSTFTILGDVTPPELSNPSDTPDPQNPGGNVNITVDIIDDFAVDEVWVNITFPNGTSINASMNQGLGDEWFYDTNYLDMGLYSYTIWVNDTNDNWNTTGPETFEIKDSNPPAFSNLLDSPDPAENGESVNITVDVTDNVAIGGVWVNITFPNGTSINVSMNQGAGDEWFYDTNYVDLGVYTYTIWANDTSDNWNFTSLETFTIQDTDPPELSNLNDAPDPQENNEYVNITVDITDDMGVGGAWVNITYPDGSFQNVSMDKGAGDEWFYNSSFSDLGVYSYTIFTSDISGNWNFSGPGTFTIQDTDGPDFSNFNDAPDPQENGGSVNITVDAIDDIAVSEVWINITYPNSSWINISMSKGFLDEWFYNSAYNDLGVYSYIIWGNDTSNNWNFTGPGTFTIQDTEGPEFSNITASPNPQKDGGFVNITVDIWDDIGIDEVWVNVTYPNGTSINITMQKGTGNSWFYNTTYLDLGAYLYTIWANDTTSNWNFSNPRIFDIKTDIVPPLLLNATDFPDPQLPGGFVNITVEAVDDVALGVVLANITYPGGTWINVSMIQGIGDAWFYNTTFSKPGIYTYIIWANDTSDNRQATTPGSFLIEDVDSPEFDNLQGLPNPQYDGGLVNITVDVTDNVGVYGVWVNITYPDGSWVNASMSKGPGDTWYFDSPYSDLGIYSYRVWANDTSDNWNFTSIDTFSIIDMELPEILSIDDTPDPQENGGLVNITATIFDNIGVDEVWVYVIYPNGSWTNLSMIFNSGNEWFHETAYSDLGAHLYIIWAKDTSGNWNTSGPGTFIIQDTNGPTISDLLSTPAIQIMGEFVNTIVNVTDDVGVGIVRINITYPDGTWQNKSMNKGQNNEWYFNSDYSVLGIYSYTIYANDTSNNWESSGLGSFEIIYTDSPPILWGLIDSPDPQSVGGSVSISVNVADDILVEEVWLNIEYPMGVTVNMSMTQGPGYLWYYSTSYSILHVYSYTAWTRDSGNNWNTSGPRTFTIHDIVPPEFENLIDTPDPAENGEYVNISVNVFDDVAVSEVWINLRYSDGVWYNLSMSYAGSDRWYINEPYPDLGLYIYSISACDTSDNWNTSYSQSFIIHDTDGPEIIEQEDFPNQFTENEEVIISFYVTDDIQVEYVWINISLPDNRWINVTMEQMKGNQWLYNTGLTNLGNYTYTLWAVDSSGNWNSSEPLIFSIEPPIVPFEKPKLLYILLLFIYWPLILIISLIAIVKRYDSENRFSADINKIASALIKQYNKEPGKYSIGLNGISDIILLCERTGIPPEEMFLTIMAAENIRFLIDGKKSQLNDDFKKIINSLKNNIQENENG
jgi:hypothetical protein